MAAPLNPLETELLDAVRSMRAWVKLWTDDRDCKLLPTEGSLAAAAARLDYVISRVDGLAAELRAEAEAKSARAAA